MVGVGRDLYGSSSPTLLPKQGHLQQAAQNSWCVVLFAAGEGWQDNFFPLTWGKCFSYERRWARISSENARRRIAGVSPKRLQDFYTLYE